MNRGITLKKFFSMQYNAYINLKTAIRANASEPVSEALRGGNDTKKYAPLKLWSTYYKY